MGKYRPSGKVVIGGQFFDTDAPIVNFTEGPRWDATSESLIATETDPNPFAHPGAVMVGPGRWTAYDADHKSNTFTKRCQGRPALRHKWNNGLNAPYDAAKQVIRQFMIHHDGCASADMCFSVAQNERGLSVHFLCDNDGTIYQTLDLALEGWHGSELNPASIGVELCNRGDAAKEPTYYSKKGQSRDVKPCKVNGHTIKSYDFTKAQYESMKRLSRALLRLLPNLPAEYPQSSPGVQTWNTVGYGGMSRFNGYLGHYHLTDNKWDPGPFDFKDFCQGIRGAFSFPLYPTGGPKKDKSGALQTQPVVPSVVSAVREEADLLLKLNEERADGGFFPVGPWGEFRLWHGGIHIAPQAKDGKGDVFAPFPGRLVAARMGPPSPIGSTNFVLLRHQMTLTDRKLEFYSLYMHLADATKSSTTPEWLVKAREAKKTDKSGEVWLLDEPVEAGAFIGNVGTAGPDSLSKLQVHVELFSISDLFEGMTGSPWETVDGTSGGRFCDAKRITDIIDTNKDGLLTREELKSFYANGAGRQMYTLVTRHVSEWTADPPWAEALRQPKDLRELKPSVIEQLVADQITPGLWWDDRVATWAKLPPDGVVYHYHPIGFVRWLNEQLIDAAAQAGPQQVDASKAGEVPPGVTDDRDGGNMLSKDALSTVDECNDKITLKELVMGYEAPECGTP